MKKLLLSLLVLFCCFKAYSTPSIESFSIYSNFIQNGAIKVYNNGPSRFIASFSCGRQYVGSPPSLEDVNIQVRLAVFDNTGQAIDISKNYAGNSTIKTLGSTDFIDFSGTPRNYSNYTDIEGTIPAIYNQSRVYLQIRYLVSNNWTAWTNSNVNYGTIDVTPIPTNYGGMPSDMQQYARENGNFDTTLPPMTFIYPNDSTPVLTVGNSIYSPNQVYRLTLQVDGNLVLYKKIDASTETPLWSSRTQSSNPKPQSLFFQTDANLVLYLGNQINSSGIWNSERYTGAGLNTVSGTNAMYALQDDGNFVLYWRYVENGVNKKWVIADSQTQSGLSPHSGRLYP